ncbi:MAG TPA: YciI family protein [Thermoanaerobaculia bacterium]|nr:YciI family protein [Thermoanaerobaculia bacterium]
MPPPHPDLLTQLFLVFLYKGPQWTAQDTPESARVLDGHFAHLDAMRQAGHLLLSGPLPEGGELRGLSLYQAGSLAEARALAESDPAVQAGRFILQVQPMLVQMAHLRGLGGGRVEGMDQKAAR